MSFDALALAAAGLKALCDEYHAQPDDVRELRVYAPGAPGLAMVAGEMHVATTFRPEEVAAP